MNDREGPAQREEAEQAVSDTPNPEARAFSGHPDHPPATPDQPLEGNEELLKRGDEASEEEPADGHSAS